MDSENIHHTIFTIFQILKRQIQKRKILADYTYFTNCLQYCNDRAKKAYMKDRQL